MSIRSRKPSELPNLAVLEAKLKVSPRNTSKSAERVKMEAQARKIVHERYLELGDWQKVADEFSLPKMRGVFYGVAFGKREPSPELCKKLGVVKVKKENPRSIRLRIPNLETAEAFYSALKKEFGDAPEILNLKTQIDSRRKKFPVVNPDQVNLF